MPKRGSRDDQHCAKVSVKAVDNWWAKLQASGQGALLTRGQIADPLSCPAAKTVKRSGGTSPAVPRRRTDRSVRAQCQEHEHRGLQGCLRSSYAPIPWRG